MLGYAFQEIFATQSRLNKVRASILASQCCFSKAFIQARTRTKRDEKIQGLMHSARSFDFLKPANKVLGCFFWFFFVRVKLRRSGYYAFYYTACCMCNFFLCLFPHCIWKNLNRSPLLLAKICLELINTGWIPMLLDGRGQQEVTQYSLHSASQLERVNNLRGCPPQKNDTLSTEPSVTRAQGEGHAHQTWPWPCDFSTDASCARAKERPLAAAFSPSVMRCVAAIISPRKTHTIT